MKKILVTGAFGQIGSELVPTLQKSYGKNNVVAVGHNHIPKGFNGIVESVEITDGKAVTAILKKHNVGTIYHLVSLLSAKGEIDPSVTWNINMNGLKTVLDYAVENKLKVFWPSSIAAFGPTTMYGVTKLAGENFVNYYHLKYGVDVRSVRYPGLISWKAPPGGGTTDFAVAIFYDGLRVGKYECFVRPDTMLPMMYMDDGIRATIELMEADPKKLTIHNSYNLAAISFTAEELAKEINKHIKVKVTYKPDFHQAIADSWPQSIDDSQARKDWGWRHGYNLDKMTRVMIAELKKKFAL